MTPAQDKALKAVYEAFGKDAIVLSKENGQYIGHWTAINDAFPKILRDILSRCK